MNKSAITLIVLVAALSLFIVGCGSSGYNYNAPPSNVPVGGGCGVSSADTNAPLAGQAAGLTGRSA